MKVRNKNALEPNVERMWERPSAQTPKHPTAQPPDRLCIFVCLQLFCRSLKQTHTHIQPNITKHYLHKCDVRIEISLNFYTADNVRHCILDSDSGAPASKVNSTFFIRFNITDFVWMSKGNFSAYIGYNFVSTVLLTIAKSYFSIINKILICTQSKNLLE